MALPEDMQIVPVILFKDDVKKIDKILKAKRRQFSSRSAYLRSVIEAAVSSFSLPSCSLEETSGSNEKQPESSAA